MASDRLAGLVRLFVQLLGGQVPVARTEDQVAQRHALPRRTQPGGTQALEHAIGKLAPAGHGLRHCTLFHHFDTIRIT